MQDVSVISSSNGQHRQFWHMFFSHQEKEESHFFFLICHEGWEEKKNVRGPLKTSPRGRVLQWTRPLSSGDTWTSLTQCSQIQLEKMLAMANAEIKHSSEKYAFRAEQFFACKTASRQTPCWMSKLINLLNPTGSAATRYFLSSFHSWNWPAGQI